MSILAHVEASPEERVAYLKQAAALRRAAQGADDAATDSTGPDAPAGDEEEAVASITLSPERFAELAAREEFLLAVSERGYGKRSSAYDYRLAGRGGQGLWGMDMTDRNGPLVATFPVKDGQEIMLVTDGGKIIRMPTLDIRIAGRKTQGVTLFRIDETEKVVSVAALEDSTGEGLEENEMEDGAPEATPEA